MGSLDPLIISPDTVLDGQNNQIVFFHRNPTSVWTKNLLNQGLDALVIPSNDPLMNRTFGALVRGDNLIQEGKNQLTSAQPATSFSIKVHALTAVTPTAGDWVNQVTAQAATTEATQLAAARTAHTNWWQAFWNRSWIVANESANTAAQTVTSGYTLQRWINACAGRGAYPIKFNGSLFNVETLTNPVQSYNGLCQ